VKQVSFLLLIIQHNILHLPKFMIKVNIVKIVIVVNVQGVLKQTLLALYVK